MLPILKQLEFSKILPLSEKSVETISFRAGINKFLAENGAGKTTLTDLIEHSLVRDAHAFAWNVFSKKRVDKTAYVKAEWTFGEEVNSIIHELTDAGARTRVTSAKFSNKAHTRDMYSDFLYSRTNHAAVYNLFNVQRHLISRPTLRQFRNEAFEQWRQATASV